MSLMDFIIKNLLDIGVRIEITELISNHNTLINSFNKNFCRLNHAGKKVSTLQAKKSLKQAIIKSNIKIKNNFDIIQQLDMQLEVFNASLESYCKLCTLNLITIKIRHDGKDVSCKYYKEEIDKHKLAIYEKLLIAAKSNSLNTINEHNYVEVS